MGISMNNGSLTAALTTHLTDREIEAHKGTQHAREQTALSRIRHWKWGVQTPHLMLLVLPKLPEVPRLVLACWPVGSWRGSLHFLTLQPPSTAPCLRLSNLVCVED